MNQTLFSFEKWPNFGTNSFKYFYHNFPDPKENKPKWKLEPRKVFAYFVECRNYKIAGVMIHTLFLHLEHTSFSCILTSNRKHDFDFYFCLTHSKIFMIILILVLFLVKLTMLKKLSLWLDIFSLEDIWIERFW